VTLRSKVETHFHAAVHLHEIFDSAQEYAKLTKEKKWSVTDGSITITYEDSSDGDQSAPE
jgi:hypothetical protein